MTNDQALLILWIFGLGLCGGAIVIAAGFGLVAMFGIQSLYYAGGIAAVMFFTRPK